MVSHATATIRNMTASNQSFNDLSGTDRWLTRAEVAARYQLSIATLAEWATRGTGPRYGKFGKHVRYRLADVLDWERERLEVQGSVPASVQD